MNSMLKDMEVSDEEMKKKSKAAFGLMKFVKAVVAYCEVAKEVKPKRERVCIILSKYL